jgi:hypothetical protein
MMLNAGDYDALGTELCERALVTVIGGAGFWGRSLYLVGGLAPRYLVGAVAPPAPAHVGSRDVDLAVAFAVEGFDATGYETLERNLRIGGFRQAPNEGDPEFRWRRTVDGRDLVLEFLCDTDEVPEGRNFNPGLPAATVDDAFRKLIRVAGLTGGHERPGGREALARGVPRLRGGDAPSGGLVGPPDDEDPAVVERHRGVGGARSGHPAGRGRPPRRRVEGLRVRERLRAGDEVPSGVSRGPVPPTTRTRASREERDARVHATVDEATDERGAARGGTQASTDEIGLPTPSSPPTTRTRPSGDDRGRVGDARKGQLASEREPPCVGRRAGGRHPGQRDCRRHHHD